MRLVPLIVVGFMMLINFVRGSIHAFAPDGGAHAGHPRRGTQVFRKGLWQSIHGPASR